MLLVLPFVFYVSNSKARRDHNFFDRIIVSLSSPVQAVVTGTLDGIANFWQRYVALWNVQEENDTLRLENAQLQAILAQREEAQHENERLRRLLGLREVSQVDMVLARVVSVAPTPMFRSVRIDQGTSSGIHMGAAVVGAAGVVGRVAAVAKYHADVMLMVDINNSTDVLVQRTRARARVRGSGRNGALALHLEYLMRTADVEPGDVLVTSGVGSVFPKGLRVGRVVSVERGAFGLYQRADVEPTVDFSRLEAVMVIPKGWSKGASFDGVGPAMSSAPQSSEAASP